MRDLCPPRNVHTRVETIHMYTTVRETRLRVRETSSVHLKTFVPSQVITNAPQRPYV